MYDKYTQENMNTITDEEIIYACKTSLSMMEAKSKLKIHFNTFKKRALLLGVYKTNQGGVGINKTKHLGVNKFLLIDILNGKHPQYQTFKLKNRLIIEGIKKNECDMCGITLWNNLPISLELHHKNGNSSDHNLKNLTILCPNCHSQTTTFRAKTI